MLMYNTLTGLTELDGQFEGYGYSGHGYGRNNPDMEDVVGVGPIPRGDYAIGEPFTHPKTGPLTFRLTPIGHDAHNRDGFMLHGDNKTHDASHGCVVQGLCFRKALAASKTRILKAV